MVEEPRKDKIVLVACCGQKMKVTCAAKDMYISDLFKKSRRWAETFGDFWFILSAKHGLLEPGAIISPYNEVLAGQKRREIWDNTVARAMEPFRSQEIIVLAGEAYCGWTRGFNVSRPLEGLRIGQQLAWLNKECER
jgi:hypothetical protein